MEKIIMDDPAFEVPMKKINDYFYGLHNQMKPCGRLVIVTRPHDCSHYPLFPAAADVWKASHPPVTFFSERLHKAGFEVKMKSSTFMIETSTKEWVSQLKSGYFRALDELDEDEMEEGIEELEDMIQGSEQIMFEEKLVIICAEKPRDGAGLETLIVQDLGNPNTKS